MDLLAHLVFGVWVYVRYGNPWSIFLSAIFDIDHVLGFLYDKRRKIPAKVSPILHIAYRPRTWLHSITGFLIIAIPFSLFMPLKTVIIPLAAHLLMDVIDRHGVLLLPPFSKKKITGPLPVSYIWDNPVKPTHYRNAHIPSLIFIALFSLMIVLPRLI